MVYKAFVPVLFILHPTLLTNATVEQSFSLFREKGREDTTNLLGKKQHKQKVHVSLLLEELSCEIECPSHLQIDTSELNVVCISVHNAVHWYEKCLWHQLERLTTNSSDSEPKAWSKGRKDVQLEPKNNMLILSSLLLLFLIYCAIEGEASIYKTTTYLFLLLVVIALLSQFFSFRSINNSDSSSAINDKTFQPLFVLLLAVEHFKLFKYIYKHLYMYMTKYYENDCFQPSFNDSCDSGVSYLKQPLFDTAHKFNFQSVLQKLSSLFS
ncbi:hypothetical protein RFI_27432 [Reticulomyxa filosa]|uniref:HAT C-terminal dimerisation domain-containing protein n=1 Tax=Reticulomyxa filosa TaxID=46433 RepID=X6M7R6_RETFI|nr:hypothetical protein RFI_27432 [Reticulomyxa filosa]|eukprot:ETO09949.1 hypothetical protein RFI_27432 [Reticulomyxa filosa]